MRPSEIRLDVGCVEIDFLASCRLTHEAASKVSAMSAIRKSVDFFSRCRLQGTFVALANSACVEVLFKSDDPDHFSPVVTVC